MKEPHKKSATKSSRALATISLIAASLALMVSSQSKLTPLESFVQNSRARPDTQVPEATRGLASVEATPTLESGSEPGSSCHFSGCLDSF